jgi:hypothetical protein
MYVGTDDGITGFRFKWKCRGGSKLQVSKNMKNFSVTYETKCRHSGPIADTAKEELRALLPDRHRSRRARNEIQEIIEYLKTGMWPESSKNINH